MRDDLAERVVRLEEQQRKLFAVSNQATAIVLNLLVQRGAVTKQDAIAALDELSNELLLDQSQIELQKVLEAIIRYLETDGHERRPQA
jgi:hypothetical protein